MILLGKYRVDELIGSGGMGQVVRASHLFLNQPVAIKIMLTELADSESTVARFLREAQSTVRLRSEHIARVMDVGTLPDRAPFMVMEFLDGNDLNQILCHHGPQSPAVVVDLMLQACEGMAEAHALGIVHRDIKPSNFFITRRPDGSMLLKILDFGISKMPVGYEDLTGAQTVIGTPSYMAPEHMKSGRSCDARSDIWSIGVVIYQLVTGRTPFVGETYADLVIKVSGEPPAPIHVALPSGLGDVMLRCLEKDPRNRQQDVGELARMLAPFATDPASAAQGAARTTRILSNRGQQGRQGSPLSAGGGLTVPLSPSQLTPRSFRMSSPSVSHGAGQVTHRTRGSRTWMLAGIASIVVLGGAAGYIVAGGGSASVIEPQAQPPGAPAASVPGLDANAVPPPAPPRAATVKPPQPAPGQASTSIRPGSPPAPVPAPQHVVGVPPEPSQMVVKKTSTETTTVTKTGPNDGGGPGGAPASLAEIKPAPPKPAAKVPPPEPGPNVVKAVKPVDKPAEKSTRPAVTRAESKPESRAPGTKPIKPATPTPPAKSHNDDLFDTRH